MKPSCSKKKAEDCKVTIEANKVAEDSTERDGVYLPKWGYKITGPYQLYFALAQMMFVYTMSSLDDSCVSQRWIHFRPHSNDYALTALVWSCISWGFSLLFVYPLTLTKEEFKSSRSCNFWAKHLNMKYPRVACVIANLFLFVIVASLEIPFLNHFVKPEDDKVVDEKFMAVAGWFRTVAEPAVQVGQLVAGKLYCKAL